MSITCIHRVMTGADFQVWGEWPLFYIFPFSRSISPATVSRFSCWFLSAGNSVSYSHTPCFSAPSYAVHPAEGIAVQLPNATSKGALFACVLKTEMIIIKDVRRIMSGILSRSAHLASRPVLHYRITLCSAAPRWLCGVGQGFVRDWGQSQQCLQTQEECQREMAKSKYDLQIL